MARTSLVLGAVLPGRLYLLLNLGLEEVLLLYEHLLGLAELLDGLGRRRGRRLLLTAEDLREEAHVVSVPLGCAALCCSVLSPITICLHCAERVGRLEEEVGARVAGTGC